MLFAFTFFLSLVFAREDSLSTWVTE